MINVEIPEFDLEVTQGEYKKITANKAGIYIMYDVDGNPMYVGQSIDLQLRVYSHFHGLTNTAGYHYYFDTCKIFFEEDEINRDIYEIFLINTLKAPVNLKMKHRRHFKLPEDLKVSPNTKKPQRCNHIKKDGKKCRQYAHTNGLCHMHGGNGVSRRSQIREFLESNYNL
ncbi:GIY-YIG nuclease family protein [Priestia flexa]|uniref:GIY-YIG nuclease family protein n=1 Tax=Priestia flexa TaxID=86664 RepID=UPI003D0659AE